MKTRIEWEAAPVRSALTVWVEGHMGAAERARPRVTPDARRVWPRYVVEHRGRALYFASAAELRHAIEVLGQRHLPRSSDVAGRDGHVNRHWLSRLHASWTPWPVRARLVAALKRLLDEAEGDA